MALVVRSLLVVFCAQLIMYWAVGAAVHPLISRGPNRSPNVRRPRSADDACGLLDQHRGVSWMLAHILITLERKARQ